jgi:uncharacterized Fe-S cluster protein YjdI
MQQLHPREAAMTAKDYSAPQIVVSFDGARCRHFGECVRGAPAVFDTSARPWIQPANGDPQLVADVVSRCPSGALHYRIPEGQAGAATTEAAEPVTTLTPLPGGPLLVRGDLRLALADGVLTEVRMAACACGNTANSPFCDGACGYEPSAHSG